MRDLSGVFKAYDIRGIVGEQLDTDLVRDIGAAFARLIGGQRRASSSATTCGTPRRRWRAPSPTARRQEGVDVIMIGLASTDMLYFASGSLDLPGAMFTASHNPAKYNGIKLCRAGAAPVGQDTGLAEIQREVEADTPPTAGRTPGTARDRATARRLRGYLHDLVDLSGIRPLKVVVDAGNGMGGHTVPAVFDGLPIDVVPMYFELDGTFPNHEANPLDPKNIVDLQAKVREVGADAGVAFDGDADRCFVVDERGEPVPPSAITALVAVRELAKDPGGTIDPQPHHLPGRAGDRRRARRQAGPHPRRPLVHQGRDGHDRRDLRRRALRALLLPRLLARRHRHAGRAARAGRARRAGPPAVRADLRTTPATPRPARSTPRSTTRPAGWRRSRRRSTAATGCARDELDGLTVELPDGGWFNLRPSNTEPLLRLNVEAADDDAVAALRDEVLAIVRGLTQEENDGSPARPAAAGDPGLPVRRPRAAAPSAARPTRRPTC